MPSNPSSESAIFHSALRIQSDVEREAFLRDACGEDAALRQRVELLLSAFAEGSQFLEHPASGLTDTAMPKDPREDQTSETELHSPQPRVVVSADQNPLSATLNDSSGVAVPGSAASPAPEQSKGSAISQHARYRLDDEIARGGMGAVIRGRDTNLGRDLAIKVLLDAHKDRPDVIERFVEEAQIGGQLQHPGIAPIYELGQFADKRPFIAMKLVKGQTLSNLLAGRDAVTEERGKFVGIFEQICQTMAYAHSRGVIHRDLKPSNIMVGAFGEVQVMDWGLAKVLHSQGETVTASTKPPQDDSIIHTLRSGGRDTPLIGSSGSETKMGSVIGTPAYMPPEQAVGAIDQLDQRADVFGLGAILCEILTRKPPYVADNSTLVYRMASRGSLKDAFLRLDDCGADEDLIRLTKRCLQPEPTDRPRDAGVLAAQVTGYLESVQEKLREAEVQRAAEASRADAEAAQAAAERKRAEAESARAGEERKRRRTSMALAAAVVSLFALVGGGWLYMERQETNRKTAEAEKQTQYATAMAALAEQRDEERRIAETAQQVAEAAERKGRQLLYATDMQLVAALLKDDQSNAGAILSRLNAHNPVSPENVTGGHDQRGFEWHYFMGLVESRSQIVSGFEHDIVDATVTSERELVTLERDGSVRCVDLATLQPTRPTIDLARGRNMGATALSRDGRKVALAFGDQVYLYDPFTGEQVTPPITASTSPHGLTFSPDGTMLITVDTGVGWWDTTNGHAIARQDFGLGLESRYFAPPFVSEDGRLLVTGGLQKESGADDGLVVFRLNEETETITEVLNTNCGSSTKRIVTITPDGQFIAIGFPYSGGIDIHETSTGKLVQRHPRAHQTAIHRIAFNPDGTQMATGAEDGTIRVWENFLELNSYVEPQQEEREVTSITNLVGHANRIDELGFCDSGKQLFSASQDKTVRIWNLAELESDQYRSFADTRGARARLSPDGTLMAVSDEHGEIQLRDLSSGTVVAALPQREHGLASRSIAFSPDNRMLAVGYGGRQDTSDIELWDIDRRERIAILPGSTAISEFDTTDLSGQIRGLAFTQDGKQLVACFGSFEIYAGPDEGNFPLMVYDVASKQPVREIQGHRSYCAAVSFSSDGTRMASASFDGTARVWDTATWNNLHVLHNPDVHSVSGGRRVYDVAFSPDGTLLAMASAEGNVILWSVESGTVVRVLSGHVSAVWSVAFSPDGRTLASGSSDGSVRLWNTATWRKMTSLEPKTEFTSQSLSFSPDGTRLLAGNVKGNALVWSTAREDVDASVDVHWLTDLLDSNADFQNRVRMSWEPRQLRESLEELPPKYQVRPEVKAALTASRCDWHASNGRWAKAVEELERLKEMEPEETMKWFRSPCLIPIATALFEQGDSTAAAELVALANQKIHEEGIETDAIGAAYDPIFPVRLIDVSPDSPAANAGLSVDDVIWQVDHADLTPQNFNDRLSVEPGTKLHLQIQRAKSDQREEIELIMTRSFSHPSLNSRLAKLRSQVEQRLQSEPKSSSLLELRSELNGLVLGPRSQIADFNEAIETLKSQPAESVASDWQRLHRRRGNAYVALEKWKEALRDYEIGITDQSTDEQLLANQALAKANVLLSDTDAWTVIRPQPDDMESEGGADLTLKDDGSILVSGKNPDRDTYKITVNAASKRIAAIRLEAIPDSSLPERGPGRFPNQPGAGNFHLSEFRVSIDGKPQKLDEVHVSFAETEHYPKIIDGTIDEAFWSVFSRSGQANFAVFSTDLELTADNTLSLELFTSHGNYPKHNLGRFRLSYSEDSNAFAKVTQRLTTAEINDPWEKLALAYHTVGDAKALETLREQHPQLNGRLAELYVDAQDWDSAIESFNSLISDQPTDVNLILRRATAYIASEQWELAKADWVRAIELQPNRVADAFETFRRAGQWSRAAEFGLRLIDHDPELWSPQWLAIATVTRLSDDKTAYQHVCGRMLQHFVASEELMDADCVAKASLLWPGESFVDQHAADRLKRVLELGGPKLNQPWGWATLALLTYRKGNAELAIEYVANAENASPTDFALIVIKSVRAMSQQDRGQTKQAQLALNEASQFLDQVKSYDDLDNHHDFLIGEILFREANAKINSEP